MKEKLLKFHQTIKEWVTQVLLKKIVTPCILVVVYFAILGPTSLIARLFFRSALSKTGKSETSGWIRAESFSETLESSRSQS